MGIAQIPLASGGITVSDGNNAGWNNGETQWELISEYSTSSDVNSITFSNIPQTYRTLRLVWAGLMQKTGSGTHNLRINGSTSSAYSTSGTVERDDPLSAFAIHQNGGDQVLLTPNVSVPTNNYSMGHIEIKGYTAVGQKVITGYCGWQGSSSVPYNNWINGFYRSGVSSPAVTSLTLVPSSGFLNIQTAWNTSAVTLYGGK